MKTLSKLTIKSEKVLPNAELKQLKGGLSGYCWVYYNDASVYPWYYDTQWAIDYYGTYNLLDGLKSTCESVNSNVQECNCE